VPSGEKPSWKTLTAGTVETRSPVEASMTETLVGECQPKKNPYKTTKYNVTGEAYCSGDAQAKYLLSGE
jgi:hypothetical protein